MERLLVYSRLKKTESGGLMHAYLSKVAQSHIQQLQSQ